MMTDVDVEAIVREVLSRVRAQQRNCLRVDDHVVSTAVLDGRIENVEEVVVAATAVVTPLARDLLKERGVALRRCSRGRP